MLNKEKLQRLMGILGGLTEEQKAALTEAMEKPVTEEELLGKLGVKEGGFAEFLRAVASERSDADLRAGAVPG